MNVRPFRLERYYAEHEFTTPLQLSASDCEPWTAAELLRLAGVDPGLLLGRKLGYTETSGAGALREAIAAHYPGCTAADVLVCNAPQEAIFLWAHATLQSGDRVVVQQPCYQSLGEVAASMGCEVVPWEQRGSGGYDVADLEALAAGGRATVVVTNAPHNPTGAQPTRAEWRRLAELVDRLGLHWFSDEMYRGLEPDDAAALPPAATLHDGAVSLWGLSKTFGLAGLRLGWVVCRSAPLRERMETLKDYTTICSNALSEVLGRVALECAPELVGRNRARIAANARRMDAFAAANAGVVEWQAPAAGPVALARISGEPASAHAAAVRHEGALLVPSALFGLPDDRVRIGLGRADFGAGLRAWQRVLDARR